MDTAPNTPTPPTDGGEPKKFIRTFAGDMQTFQEGGQPDLTPYEGPEQTPAERLVGASPVAPEVTPMSIQPPAPIEVQTPVAPATPEPEPEPIPTPIETYASDFSKHMRDTNASTVSVLAAEQDAAREVPQEEDISVDREAMQKNILYIIAGALFLIIGGGGVYIAYSQYAKTNIPVIVASTPVAPIFVDSTENVSGTGTALFDAIQQAVDKPLALGAVKLLTLSDASAGASIFTALDLHEPGLLMRNISATGNMAGIINTAHGESLFFILSVESYAAAFSGLLSWESLMPHDLEYFFPPYPVVPPVVTTATTTATSTASVVAPPTPKTSVVFRDEVVSNHDVRVYRDALQRSVLLYGFWDQSTIIIARDPAAFAEIIGRLAAAHMTQ